MRMKVVALGLIREKVALINAMKVLVMIFALIASAYIRIWIPFTPVPITMQTLVVLVGSAWLRSFLAPLAVSIYILLGLLGLPVLAGGSGISKIVGATGGYLIGFVVVSAIISYVLQKSKSLLFTVLVFSLASIMILSIGTLFLAINLQLRIGVAMYLGFLPFLPGDMFKAFLAAGFYKALIAKYK